MTELDFSRRTWLAALAAGAVPWPGANAAEASRETQDAAESRPRNPITVETIAAAEAIFGGVHTAEERTLLVQRLGVQRRQAARRPTPPLGAADPPWSLSRGPRSISSAAARTPASWPAKGRDSAAASAPLEGADLAFASLADLGAALRSGRTTSAKLAEFFLARLERHDPTLRAVVTLCRERALEEARAADADLKAGRDRGPLHGIPYGLKDLFDTAGVRTTWGAEPFKDRTPTADSAVATLLREAGAVLVAKLSLGELAMGDTWFGGMTRNPWNPEEGSSGSSAGSASATVAGLVPFAIGTETLGSIVSPSMRCGATGFRPALGRISLDGAMTLCWSLDKAGPIARSALDAATVYAALDPSAWPRKSLISDLASAAPEALVRGLKVGFVPSSFEGPGAEREADRAALEALRSLGAELIASEIPRLPYDALYSILAAESAASMEEWTATKRVDGLAQQEAGSWPNRFRASRFLSAVDVLQVDRLRSRVASEFDRLFAPLDAFVGPSFSDQMLIATNFTGHPCLVVRTGFTSPRARAATASRPAGPSGESPHGISIWGRLDDVVPAFRLGVALDRTSGASAKRPPLFV